MYARAKSKTTVTVESQTIESSIFKTTDNSNQKSFPLLSQTLRADYLNEV